MLNLLLFVLVIMKLSEILAKRIPDSKTGIVGGVRRIAKIIALYTENLK